MDTWQEELHNKVYRRLIAAPVVVGLMLFVPAVLVLSSINL
jgi:hypothetical protein